MQYYRRVRSLTNLSMSKVRKNTKMKITSDRPVIDELVATAKSGFLLKNVAESGRKWNCYFAIHLARCYTTNDFMYNACPFSVTALCFKIIQYLPQSFCSRHTY